MPARAETIRRLARRAGSARSGTGVAVNGGPVNGVSLESVPGIGRWTAEYIAMRALGEPDAFPCGDRVLRGAAGHLSARELDRRSDRWRPWRAYAVMLLWQTASEATS
jgi:AraC family transcriptional regulator of adaptative response / DNA-3-methyladenine glycosylase II